MLRYFPSRLLLLGVTLSVATAKRPRPGQCSNVAFQLSATVENNAFANPPDPNNMSDVLQFVAVALGTSITPNGTQTIRGNFTIHGVYCKPTKKLNKHPDTLQVLVHGITYNSTMWSGYGFGDRYNWHTYANAEGYYTLAIDRVGHGLNSRTHDPLDVVQSVLHVELMHQLINAVRANAANNALDKGFTNIAYVGHSYGSLIGTQVARLYPADIAAAVLTGYSTTSNSTTVASFQLTPAAIHSPTRFPSVPLGYLVMSNDTQREAAFYGGGYDPAIAATDFAHGDIVTIGEFGSIGFLIQPPVGWAGAVMVVTGVLDAVFCTPTQAGCDRILENTRDFFPEVSNYEYYAPPNTGHVLTLHYSAEKTFKKVHTFLDKYF